jgi:EAL and modified HD-GYP domain-containing signal transduction protein
VSLLALREFGKWVTVVALTTTERRPCELSLVALTRARAAELVARATGSVDPEEAFTVGLVSALDALFEQPLEGLLAGLPLSASVREAALQLAGPAGHILSAVVSRDDAEADPTGFEPGLLNHAWLEALAWAEHAQRSVA